MGVIHGFFVGVGEELVGDDWRRFAGSVDELIPFTHALARITSLHYYRGMGLSNLPLWLISPVLNLLSQDPLPPTTVVVNCLSIIFMGLDYDTLVTGGVESDEQYVCVIEIITSPLIPRQYET